MMGRGVLARGSCACGGLRAIARESGACWQWPFPLVKLWPEPYGLRPDSGKGYLYYLVRLRDELMRTSRTLGRLLIRDSGVTEAAKQDKALAEWLESG